MLQTHQPPQPPGALDQLLSDTSPIEVEPVRIQRLPNLSSTGFTIRPAF